MADESPLLLLPNEIIEKILDYPILSIEDLGRLQSVCSFFNEFIKIRQVLWRKRLLYKYAFLKNLYSTLAITDWYGQCKHIAETKEYVYEKTREMSSLYHWRYTSLSPCDMDPFLEKCKGNAGLAKHYVLHFLTKILDAEVPCDHTFDESVHVSLTTQYYAKKVHTYVMQEGVLKAKWYQMRESGSPFTPDKVCKFALQWLYPTVTQSSFIIDHFSDLMNKLIMDELPPEHQLLTIDENTRAKWKTEILTDNQLDERHCKDIIERIARLLYRLDVCRILILDGLCRFKMEETAARRCGVRIIIKGSKTHRFLYWRQNWSARTPRYLIESMSGAMKLSTGRCPYAVGFPFEPLFDEEVYDPTEVLLTVMPQIEDGLHKEIVQYAVDCAFAVSPFVPLHVCTIVHIYGMQKKRLEQLTLHIEDILKNRPLSQRDRRTFVNEHERIIELNQIRINEEINYTIPIKRRKPFVSFSIGLICRHSLLNYVCVIRGWDYECTASRDWQKNMKLEELELGSKQPFYIVTAEDGSERYVAQENLEFVKCPQRMKNTENVICIDFTHFDGFVYVPNAEKLIQYPDDPDHITFYVSKMIPYKMALHSN